LQLVPEQMYPPLQATGDAGAHEPFEHVPRSTKLVPEQLVDPQREVGYWQTPSERPAHEPAHVASVPQEALQQLPSDVQVDPAMQPPAVAVHACPFLLLQAPDPSQVPAQRARGSSALVTATHACDEEHVLHAPQSAVVQHPPVAMQVVVPPEVQACVFAGHA
jgi:hypothetical protein